ncbi:maltose/moltooligosaccharide transporter [Flagellimonas taeanensis]|jgi:maltose/moltooligosaccharide transporter|uniref:Maltose/moltooligosaccharide transporter n=1 Tax=Flagellimonas taeanensis TaxID=1005926 RepID=A0A1M6TH36_9FLAO|nr:MFS transporter [Allomuricauda taeanensis]MEE1962203.1 MFS transporter [Allomuricauda taeanensis]SFB88289.1 maltose/moltooligosaccharide transporter [Allomuricauda taeanensis]SHK56305.1 maltose/moltooligosaccharide transporter [Allomuricauda taeanensis]
MIKITKPKLSFWQIFNMNVGFLGIQYSFGLQQSAVNSIFLWLGAKEEMLPILNIAGPVTGLVVQPIVGAISDKTWSFKWGRRKPFFLIGAIMASICLFAFPQSPSLWFAAGLFWILDVGNNMAMEPYRAFVGDKLPDEQLSLGYQMQSLFVGAGILLATGAIVFFQKFFGAEEPEVIGVIPKWVFYPFLIGSILSIATILWSVWKTPEIPPSEEEIKSIREFNKGKPSAFVQIVGVVFILFSLPLLLGFLIGKQYPALFEDINLWVVIVLLICTVWFSYLFRLIKKNTDNTSIKKFADVLAPFLEVGNAVKDMPRFMWKIAAVYLFQWYALFVYWQFITPLLRVTMEMDTSEATAQAATMSLTYNIVTTVVALLLVPLTVRFGGKKVYALSLVGTAVALFAIPQISDPVHVLYPMVLFGIGWAAMMGIPYSMVSKIVPQQRRGVYMGILNMMIVIPMFIQTISFGPIFKHLLGANSVNAILFAGACFVVAAILAMRLTLPKSKRDTELDVEIPEI